MGGIFNALSKIGFGSLYKAVPQLGFLMIGLRIVVLLFLIGWVRTHMGGGTIATVVMLVIGYFMLFKYWYLFGPLAIIYLLAIFGAMGLITDFLFTRQHYLPGLEPGMGEIRRPPPI